MKKIWIRYTNIRDSNNIDSQEYKDLKNFIVNYYMKNVYYRANMLKSKISKYLDYEDIVSAGVLGLLRAMDKYDHKLGYSFNTCCEKYIYGAIIDECRNLSWLPRGAVSDVIFMPIEDYDLESSDSYGVNHNRYDNKLVENKDFWSVITRTMTREETLILTLFFKVGFTNEEVGRVIGLSNSRVSQQKNNLLKRLKIILSELR